MELNFPDLSLLLSTPPKVTVWKSHVKKHLAFKAQLEFIEDCEAYHVSSCDFISLRPAPHWTITLGNLTRVNLFRVCLLVGCDGLEKDAAKFWTRHNGRAALHARSVE